MAEFLVPDMIVYVCTNCIPKGARLPHQWKQDGCQVLLREVPCSGKTDLQYLMHAIEGGCRGACVVTCPEGDCRLAQGNYRAEIRIRTIQRLLAEIGMESARAELLHCPADKPLEHLQELIRGAVARICALGANPICAACGN